MVELLVVAAFLVLLVGVAGSFLPLIPSGPAALAGVLLYWHATGYTAPGPVALAALVLVGVVTTVVEYAGGATAAKAAGASNLTTAAAVVVGIALLFVAGPAGIVVGIAGTVFVAEFARNREASASARTALYATVGVLASSVVQFLLTGSILLALALVHLF